ncbi:MAG: hypothetical protein VKL39_03635 [Leptolyngbyaceae bacterium]|nr:hypothetical protein [Leptolyngbyaceae bacterium]
MARSFNHIRQLTMKQGLSLVTCCGIALGVGLTNASVVEAQEFIREGKLQLVLIQEMASNEFTVVSTGMLRDLQTDPFFDGDYNAIFNSAAAILDNYTPVVRGGYFPENAGIPREQQVTVDEAIYRVFRLTNGYELMLYRSPMEDTSRYFIRQS